MSADSNNTYPPRSLPFFCTFQYEYKIRVFKMQVGLKLLRDVQQ